MLNKPLIVTIGIANKGESDLIPFSHRQSRINESEEPAAFYGIACICKTHRRARQGRGERDRAAPPIGQLEQNSGKSGEVQYCAKIGFY